MKNFRTYKYGRRPRMASTALGLNPSRTCPAAYYQWRCTRERYHTGRHEAGGRLNQVLASWEEGDH